MDVQFTFRPNTCTLGFWFILWEDNRHLEPLTTSDTTSPIAQG